MDLTLAQESGMTPTGTESATLSPEPEPPAPGIRVLLVENDELVLRSTSRGLSDLGFDVVTSRTGRDGLAFLRTSVCDVVVLDLRLDAGAEAGIFSIEARYTHGLRHVFFGPPASPLIKARRFTLLVRVRLN